MAHVLNNILARCAPNSELSQTILPPPPKFIPSRDLPDLSGKIVFVTGGNTGIGYQTVKELLLKNAKVYSASRSTEKAQRAADKLIKDIGKTPILIQLDLGDLSSIKRAAIEFFNQESRLDVLMNNAGVMAPPTEELTAQKYDLQFGLFVFCLFFSEGYLYRSKGTNVLGHYYLTTLLLPALKMSAFDQGNGIEWCVLKDSPERTSKIEEWGTSRRPGKGATWHLYGISKMGNIMLTQLFNRHYPEFIASYSVHPGGIRTELQRHGNAMERAAAKALLNPPKFGPISQLWAGIMPEAESAVGAYVIPWARLWKPDPRSENKELQEELKAYLDEQIHLFEISSNVEPSDRS